MGLLGELPPLRFGTWGHAKKGSRQPLALSKPRQTQPLARARTGGSRSVSVLAQKRKLVDKVSATGETKRRRKMQPHERRQEQLPGQQRTCRWFDPKVSEVDHFANHSHANHSQGQRILHPVRSSSQQEGLRGVCEAGEWAVLANDWRSQRCMGHGLYCMRSIRSHWRARRFPKV